jgi:hypothetical protein
MESSMGRAMAICGALACTTGIGAVLGLPMIFLGILIAIFGKKPK